MFDDDDYIYESTDDWPELDVSGLYTTSDSQSTSEGHCPRCGGPLYWNSCDCTSHEGAWGEIEWSR